MGHVLGVGMSWEWNELESGWGACIGRRLWHACIESVELFGIGWGMYWE